MLRARSVSCIVNSSPAHLAMKLLMPWFTGSAPVAIVVQFVGVSTGTDGRASTEVPSFSRPARAGIEPSARY